MPQQLELAFTLADYRLVLEESANTGLQQSAAQRKIKRGFDAMGTTVPAFVFVDRLAASNHLLPPRHRKIPLYIDQCTEDL